MTTPTVPPARHQAPRNPGERLHEIRDLKQSIRQCAASESFYAIGDQPMC